MSEDYKRVDIRILKYKEYIKKHPDKAYGYYCLGRLYMAFSNEKTAEGYYKKALSLNSEYVPALIGLMEVYIVRKSFSKAAKIFEKNSLVLSKKNIHRIKLARMISSYYESALFKNNDGPISSLRFKYNIKSLSKSFNENPDNIAASLLLCIYFQAVNEKSDKAVVIYNMCVYMDGLNDNMRWSLIKILSKDVRNESRSLILKNTKIASKFYKLPTNNCSADYANLIFSTAMDHGKSYTIQSILCSNDEIYKILSLSNLWKYIDWCMERNVLNKSVYYAAKRLISKGWIDKQIAQTLMKLKNMNIAKKNNDEDRILSLYGYNDTSSA